MRLKRLSMDPMEVVPDYINDVLKRLKDRSRLKRIPDTGEIVLAKIVGKELLKRDIYFCYLEDARIIGGDIAYSIINGGKSYGTSFSNSVINRTDVNGGTMENVINYGGTRYGGTFKKSSILSGTTLGCRAFETNFIRCDVLDTELFNCKVSDSSINGGETISGTEIYRGSIKDVTLDFSRELYEKTDFKQINVGKNCKYRIWKKGKPIGNYFFGNPLRPHAAQVHKTTSLSEQR